MIRCQHCNVGRSPDGCFIVNKIYLLGEWVSGLHHYMAPVRFIQGQNPEKTLCLPCDFDPLPTYCAEIYQNQATQDKCL